MLPLNRALCAMLAGVLVATMPAAAQVRADSAAIRATALDYIEGWYTGNAARMERSLHPHLAKRFVEPRADGSIQLTGTTALELVQQVRNGGGSATPGSVRRTDVRILDIFQNAASVRVDAHGWIDYMHLAKFGDSWRIVNVLWEPRALAVAPIAGGAQVTVQDSTDIVFSITGLRGPEAVRYDADQDVYFVANFGETDGDQRDANGFIARVSAADGRVEALRFMTGTAAAPLHMPRGMNIRNDTLWVADVDGVHGFLSRTGAHAAFIDMTVHEPGFLNDIAAGPDGWLYVTDTGRGRVYRIGADGGAEVAIEHERTGPPNGITWDASRAAFLLAPWGGETMLRAWDPASGELRDLLRLEGGRFDGIEVIDGRVLIASQDDSTIHVIAGEHSRPLIRVTGRPADIGIDTRRGRVAVPYIALNRVDVWAIRQE